MKVEIREYLDAAGRSPFGHWFDGLDATAAAKVTTSLDADTLVILVAGGTKKRQSQDIALARERWGDYKQRKTKTKED